MALKFGHRTLYSLTAKSAGSSHFAPNFYYCTIDTPKPAISFNHEALRNIMIVQSSSNDQTMAHTRWGVSAARKGGLTKSMTWNEMFLSKIQEWIRKKQIAHFS